MRTLERLVKKMDKGAVRKSEKATVFAVDGNRIDIRTGSSNAIIRNVEVSGSTSGLEVGDVITVIYVNDRPFALADRVETAKATSAFSIADMTTTDAENMAVKIKDYIAAVSPSKTYDFPTSEITDYDVRYARISSLIVNEDLTDQIDGVVTNFTVSQAFVANSIALYHNGLRQRKINFSEDVATNSINLTFVPFVGDEIIIDYLRA
jgi:hypothetical protein